MSEDDDIKDCKRVLAALDKAIEADCWDKRLFLQAIGKRLEELRSRFRLNLGVGVTDSETATSSYLDKRVAKRTDQQEVFVSLYNADGGNLSKWTKLLQSMNKHAITRPVYAHEKEVRALIRGKTSKKNEAYVAVYINTDDLIEVAEDKLPTDRLGHVLLVTKDGAIKLENISYFIHESGHYILKDGQLNRQGDAHYLDM